MHEQQQQRRLEIDIGDLYGLIGQLTVENRLLRARLAATERAAASSNGAAPGEPVWRDLDPASPEHAAT